MNRAPTTDAGSTAVMNRAARQHTPCSGAIHRARRTRYTDTVDPFVRKLVLRLFDEGAPLSRNRHFHTFETEEGRRALRISKRLKALRADITKCRAEGGDSRVTTERDGEDMRVHIHLKSLHSTRHTTLDPGEYELLQLLLGSAMKAP